MNNNSYMSVDMLCWFAFKKVSTMMLLLVSSSIFAEELNLAKALSLLSKNNPSLRVFDFKQSALDGSAFSAGLKPALELGLEAENFTGSSPYSGFSQTDFTVSISSVIELGYKRDSRLNMVSTQRQLIDAQRQVKSLDLIAQLTRSFIQAIATQQRIKLADEAVKLADDIYGSVKRKASVGAISDAEVKRAFAALKQAQLTQQTELQMLESQKVGLSLFWSEKTPQFTSLSGDLFNFGEIQNVESLFDKVELSSLLKVLITKQQLAESKFRLAQTESKSNLSWSVGMRRFQETNDVAFTAGISMPLFKSKRNSGALIEAQADIDQSESEQQLTKLEMYGQIHKIFSLRKLAVERYNVLKNDVIPALIMALDLTREAYQEGRYGYLEYTAARAELIQSKRALIDTAENILTYGVEIEQITAEPIYINQPIKDQKIRGES